MSQLSSFIDRYCKDFKVDICNCDSLVFIEITHNDSFRYHNCEVALGQEVEGLTMLICEWRLMDDGIEFSETIN